jgi:hypothetical protein
VLTLCSGLAQRGLVSRAKQLEAAATESTLHSQREQRPAGQGLLGFRCTFRRTVYVCHTVGPLEGLSASGLP